MSGSKQPAEQGTLIFLTGGDEALFNRAGPLLDIMGKAKFFLGEVRMLGHITQLHYLKCITPSCVQEFAGAFRELLKGYSAESQRDWQYTIGSFL